MKICVFCEVGFEYLCHLRDLGTRNVTYILKPYERFFKYIFYWNT